MSLNGILLVDKPVGWTSFDVVGKVRGTITRSPLNDTHKKRYPVGHTGTLDPLATGLLVLLLGTYTKKAPALTKLDKTYEVVMHLGETTTTGDEEGIKTPGNSRQPTEEELTSVCQRYEGLIEQTPPPYSAVKVNGQRAYKLARQGQEVHLEPRPVHIYALHIDEYTYPLVRFTTHVSSGTYIRSLVADIGNDLGTGAYMTALRRTLVGQFKVEQALSVEKMSAEDIAAHTLD